MNIKKLYIENYKCFKGPFEIEFIDGVNILVGNNEAGKSTILEAIHLALSGLINGHYLRNELSQYLFNNEAVIDFISKIKDGKHTDLPKIVIEVFFDGDFPLLQGDGNSERTKAAGISLKIEFDESYKEPFEELVKTDLETIPIEYYKIEWRAFSRMGVTSRNIPIKPVLIDSASHRYKNGSDIYISRIVKNHLDDKQKAGISQAFRDLKETFKNKEEVKLINEQVKKDSAFISEKNIEISVDLSTRDAWESSLMTYLNQVPFHQIGKGEQCIVKTNLSLSHNKSKESNLILLEEPENHLTHSKLNEFLRNVIKNCESKQIIISTHSSFVANKLGLENITLINANTKDKQREIFYFEDLDSSTEEYFKKLSGYDTLRLILCKKAILVEGDSDELIVQKAYMNSHDGRLPIEDGIDVISVRSLAFKRFLNIAKILMQPTAVVTDNDGNYEKKITKKYKEYKDVDCIGIFFDDRNELKTLEPQFIDANQDQLKLLRKSLRLKKGQYPTKKEIKKYMGTNKTKWALRIFDSSEDIKFPEYINRVIAWCDEK